MKEISADHYYLKQPEPVQGCLLALKAIILDTHSEISHGRMYQIPFFFYKGKKLAFLWMNRKKLILGFVEDSTLYKKIPGQRRRSKLEMIEIDPMADLPVKKIRQSLQKLMDKYERFFEKNNLQQTGQ